MICLQGEERQAITLPDLEHIDADATPIVRRNRASIWYTTDDSQDTYKYSDRLQADADPRDASEHLCYMLTASTCSIFIASVTVYFKLAELIKGAILSQYLDHKFCNK